MVTQTEAVQAVNSLAAELEATKGIIDKVGAETDDLVQKVAELTELVQNTGQLSPELEAALSRVADQVVAVKSAATVVDDKVADPV